MNSNSHDLQTWLACVQEAGCESPVREFAWRAADDVNKAYKLSAGASEIYWAPCNTGFKALGVFITFDN